MTTARHIGVLLAAGRSSRMGRSKQLLAWPSDADTSRQPEDESTRVTPQATTVVSTSFDLIAPHCAHMIVVLGHDALAVTAALQPRAYTSVISDPDAEMLHSIRLGLVESQRQRPGSPVLLHLADVPAVSKRTIEFVLSAAGSTSKAVMPEHAGRGGHPVVVPAGLVHGIVTWQGEGGLRAYWQEHPELVKRLAVSDAGATADLDTPADYADL